MPITEEEKRKYAWEKARKVEGFDDTLFRKDACGAWIMWDKFGNRENSLGWEIDYILPLSKGGPDELFNIRALQYQNKASKKNDYPSYTAVVTAEGTSNIRMIRNLTINKQARERLKEYETL